MSCGKLCEQCDACHFWLKHLTAPGEPSRSLLPSATAAGNNGGGGGTSTSLSHGMRGPGLVTLAKWQRTSLHEKYLFVSDAHVLDLFPEQSTAWHGGYKDRLSQEKSDQEGKQQSRIRSK